MFIFTAVPCDRGLVDNPTQSGSSEMEIETFELAPGCWIVAIGVESEDRGFAGLTGKTTMPKKYQATWSTDGKWENGKTMTFTSREAAEEYKTTNLQQMMDASLDF